MSFSKLSKVVIVLFALMLILTSESTIFIRTWRTNSSRSWSFSGSIALITFFRPKPDAAKRLISGSSSRNKLINLSYDFGEFIKGMDRLRLTLAGNNLFTITDYTGLDPEATSGLNEAVERGLDQFAFPNYKTYEVRLDLTF